MKMVLFSYCIILGIVDNTSMHKTKGTDQEEFGLEVLWSTLNPHHHITFLAHIHIMAFQAAYNCQISSGIITVINTGLMLFDSNYKYGVSTIVISFNYKAAACNLYALYFLMSCMYFSSYSNLNYITRQAIRRLFTIHAFTFNYDV